MKSDCKGTLPTRHKQISKQKVYGCEYHLGCSHFCTAHSTTPQPGANCTKCHLLSRTWCHLALVRKPELLPGPSCCLGLWQTQWDVVWHKTKSSQPQTGRSEPGCELQHAQLQSCVPPLMEGSFPDRKEEAPQHLTQSPQWLHWKGPAQPSYWRCNTACQSYYPELQEPASGKYPGKKPGSTLGY